MSNYGGLSLDTSTFSLAQLEALSRTAFANAHMWSFAPYIVSAFIDSMFLGIVLLVFSFWWTDARPTERSWTRVLVYWLIFAGICASTVLQGSAMVHFVEGFGVYCGFFDVTWFKWYGTTFVISRVPASVFYLHRAYMMVGRRSWILLVTIPLLAMMLVVGIAPLIMFKAFPYSKTLKSLVATGSACELVSGLILTITIAYQLRKLRTGWKKTEFLVKRMLIALAETQTPPTILAVIMLVLFASTPNTNNQIALLFTASAKIHILCILISLLSRVGLQRSSAGESNTQIQTAPSGLNAMNRTTLTQAENQGWQPLPGSNASANELV